MLPQMAPPVRHPPQSSLFLVKLKTLCYKLFFSIKRILYGFRVSSYERMSEMEQIVWSDFIIIIVTFIAMG